MCVVTNKSPVVDFTTSSSAVRYEQRGVPYTNSESYTNE